MCHFLTEEESTRPVDLDCSNGSPLSFAADPANFVLVPPNVESDTTQHNAYDVDDISVVKMEGGIWLVPFFLANADFRTVMNANPDIAQGMLNAALISRNYFARAGLSKDKWEWDQASGVYNPPARDPWLTQEYTDARFLRIWTKEKMAGTGGAANFNTQLKTWVTGCSSCSDVSAAGAGPPANTLSSGSGTVNIPAISTDCSTDPCLVGDNNSSFSMSGGYVSPESAWYIGLRSRRRLSFKENEGLSLWLNWAAPSGIDNECLVLPQAFGVGFIVRAHVRALIES